MILNSHKLAKNPEMKAAVEAAAEALDKFNLDLVLQHRGKILTIHPFKRRPHGRSVSIWTQAMIKVMPKGIEFTGTLAIVVKPPISSKSKVKKRGHDNQQPPSIGTATDK